MDQENKRIFIRDLPETCTSDELNASFSKYGRVSSVEIKERKELGPNNTSLFFAYVNLLTDDVGLTKCFRELSNIEWHGHYVQLQVARESFLERLKREREENKNNDINSNSTVDVKSTIKSTLSPTEVQKNNYNKSDKNGKNNILFKPKSEKSASESESDSDSDSEKNVKMEIKHDAPITESIQNNLPKIEYVIKSNKNKTFDKTLSIPSVGKEPIVKITTTKNINKNDSDANLKRLQSLKDMKSNYKAKISSIKIALTYKDQKPNKVIFNDDANLNITGKVNGQQKRSLFDDYNSDNDEFETNFNYKPQFEGESGQKLLQLQSKFKNDKRFALDEKFKEDNFEEIPEKTDSNLEDIEREKNVQIKILNEVLGKNTPTLIKKSTKKDSEIKKVMIRYDPMQPESKNLEVTSVEAPKKKKKKEEAEEPLPEVSKETFYKVTNDFKETLEKKQEFSLLNMFGKPEDVDDQEHTQETEKEIKRNSLLPSQNPFKYDSSDDEDETEDIPHKPMVTEAPKHSQAEKTGRLGKAVIWRESFFFKNDDFRLQEGLDFIERIKTENKDFSKIRRDIKKIVKTKVKNNERKNKMFKKKLGRSKQRKHIRIKKALKR